MAKFSPTLGTFSSYIASILEIPSYLYIFCTRILNSRDNKEVCFPCKFLGNHSNPRGFGCARNTERALALPSAKPSLPRGLQRGEPPNVHKILLFFPKIFVSKPLEHLEKQPQGVSNYGTRPAEPRNRLRLRNTASPLTSLRLSSL